MYLIVYKDVNHYFGVANFVTGVVYSQQTYIWARQCFDFRLYCANLNTLHMTTLVYSGLAHSTENVISGMLKVCSQKKCRIKVGLTFADPSLSAFRNADFSFKGCNNSSSLLHAHLSTLLSSSDHKFSIGLRIGLCAGPRQHFNFLVSQIVLNDSSCVFEVKLSC